MAQDGVDFVLAALREEGAWQVQPLPLRAGEDLDTLVAALRPLPSESGTIGMVSVDEDFFVLVRVLGPDEHLLLSDVTAATDWPLASEVVDALDLPEPEDDDDPQPAGQLDILADLGVSAMDMAVLCDDPELYPDEMLSDVAHRLGFGAQFEAAIDKAAV
ncbi:tRNA adenosine deaminase-associated protein [soil metagenome]